MPHVRASARPGRVRTALRRPLLAALLAALVTALALAAPAVAAPAPPATETAPPETAPEAPAATAPAEPAAAPAPEPEVKPLRIGMRGAAVRELQRELRKRGVRLRPDGVFGRVTRAAVRRVQMKLGLKTTGVADQALLVKLGLAPEPEPEPVPAPEATAAPAGGAADPAAAATVATGPAAATAPGPVEEPAGRTDVVDFARTLLGTPYRPAGMDPSGFDCSGLVLYVFDRFGIEMPRSSWEQFDAFPRVPREEPQPGDVVFFNGLGHDGIYIGKGRFIHSSKPGDVVKISRLDVSWYASRYEGAVRPE
jgi:cell wall-associated NlpC family hydrolase